MSSLLILVRKYYHMYIRKLRFVDVLKIVHDPVLLRFLQKGIHENSFVPYIPLLYGDSETGSLI